MYDALCHRLMACTSILGFAAVLVASCSIATRPPPRPTPTAHSQTSSAAAAYCPCNEGPIQVPTDPKTIELWDQVASAMRGYVAQLSALFDQHCPSLETDCSEPLEPAFSEFKAAALPVVDEAKALDLESCGSFSRYHGLRDSALQSDIGDRYIQMKRAGRAGVDEFDWGSTLATGFRAPICGSYSIGPPLAM